MADAAEPRDENPATFDVVFSAKGAKAFGGGGEVPVRTLPDGSCAVSISSGGGILLVCGEHK